VEEMQSDKDKMIYGVDISKKITPIMVRDAIIDCFYRAHNDVLDLAREHFACNSEKKFKEMKQQQVRDLIEDLFISTGGDFKKPTKKALIQVIAKLKKFAAVYRETKVIEKHANEIMQLIDKMT
jgi:hypothetical protein